MGNNSGGIAFLRNTILWNWTERLLGNHAVPQNSFSEKSDSTVVVFLVFYEYFQNSYFHNEKKIYCYYIPF